MNAHEGFSGRGWLLLGAMAILWGVPYLFIRVAVESYSPPFVVSARTLLGALILLPFALRSRAMRPALRKWPWVLAFGAVEMGGPFLLLGYAEQKLDSGLTGLLVATVPLFAGLIALGGGDRGVLKPVRLLGLVLGFVGVAVVVAGPSLFGGDTDLVAAGQVLLTALLYSIAPFIIARKLGDVPSLGSITLALFAIGLFYLPFGLVTQFTQHGIPSVRSTGALLALGAICTATAFVVFFALIREVGPVRAPLFTYINPVVAILLGAMILAEPLTPGLLLGFPLIVVGCFLAATGGRLRARRTEAPIPGVDAPL